MPFSMDKGSQRLAYRPEIDGLRALAVFLVILYHLGSFGLAGGFVGVDVFFVISGYLITGLIVSELNATGSFAFGRFFYRRTKRLFPALYSTLLIVFGLSVLVAPPDFFKNVAHSVPYAAFSLSNMLFWRDSGYFDSTAYFKPLLHTWSLSVEEQFYLVFPLLLFVIYKLGQSRRIQWWLLLLGVISFAFNWIVLYRSHWIEEASLAKGATAFYWTPLRIYEFIIGAVLVWLPRYRQGSSGKHFVLPELAYILGLSLIVLPAMKFTEHTSFPGHRALWPCLGAALLIAVNPPKYVGRILTNKYALHAGIRSYSLYLLHWPLIVFYFYLTLRPLRLFEQTAIFLMTYLGAMAMYKYIENPLRHSENIFGSSAKRMYAGFVMSSLIALSAVMLYVQNGDGWLWRLPEEKRGFKAQSYLRHSKYGGSPCAITPCIVGPEAVESQMIYVVGDSFSMQLAYGLKALFPEKTFKIFNDPQCAVFSPEWSRGESLSDQEACIEKRETFFEDLQKNKPAVIFANNWIRKHYFKNDQAVGQRSYKSFDREDSDELAKFTFLEIQKLKEKFSLPKVLVIGNPPQTFNDMDMATWCYHRPSFLPWRPGICSDFIPLQGIESRRYLAKFEQDTTEVLDLFSPFCDEFQCRLGDSDGYYFSDAWHLSEAGSYRAIYFYRDQIRSWMAGL